VHADERLTDPEQRQGGSPLAGAVFAVTGLGAQGLPEREFQG